MGNSVKTREQLLAEIHELRQEIVRLQRAQSDRGSLSVPEFMDNVLLGYQSLDENGRFLTINQAWLETFGYTQEQVIGRSFADFITPEAQTTFQNNFPQFKVQGRVRDVVFDMICHDGTRLVISINGQIEYNQSGEFVKTHCMLHNITPLKETEAALQESEMRYRQMFEKHPSIRWLVDSETQQLVDVNPAAAQFYGYSREAMRQMVVNDLNVLSADEIRAKMRQAEAKKRSYFEVPHRLASGEIRLVEIHAAPICVGDRQLLYAVLYDVTERREAEAALRQTNRQLALINQATEELNSTLDMDHVLTGILNEVRFLLGAVACSIWLVEEATNELVCWQATEPHSEIVRGWRLPAGEGVAGWVIDNGRSLNITDVLEDDRHYKGVDQQTRLDTRSLLCVPLKRQQHVIGVIEVIDSEPAFFSDVDLLLIESLAGTAAAAVENARLHQQLADHAAKLEERVERRTQELVAVNTQLKELDQLKTKLIEDISHELRTPLAGLSLYLDLLERGKPEKREQYMAVLRDKMKQLTDLTDDILQVFRIDLFKGDVVFQILDLNQIVSDVVAGSRQRIEDSGLLLVMALAQRPLPISAEKKQMEQVINNLLRNAINYTPSGSIHIRTELNGTKNEVCFSIQDSGLGIIPEDKAHIFDRFYRGSNTARYNLPGTGLGLSVVKDVMTLHNGRIEIDSEPEQGSTFRIWLPLAVE